MPKWLPFFFMAEGALLALQLSSPLPAFGRQIAFAAFMGGAVWYVRYRRRRVHDADSK